MGWWENNKPVLAMVGLQLCYAGLAVSTRSALLQGMSPRVYVIYRQGIATLVIAPIAYFSHGRGKSKRPSSLGLRSFYLIFVASLIGVTINQNMLFEGMYMASSSISSAMSNLIPAITFLIAAFVGLEKVDIRSVRSMAKVLGTVVCVGGAVCMTLLKGPKLLNTEFTHHNSIFLNSSSSGGENWLMGCLLVFGSCCCWSLWFILQVPISASYPNHLSISAWTCFFSTLQSATLTFFLEPNPKAWYLHSTYELLCVLYAGVIGSGVAFFVQAWCISQRGPLFSAMFNPLGTVIVTIFAGILLHEELYIGSLVGAFAVVLGLYTVLWGKAKDIHKINTQNSDSSDKDPKEVLEEVLIDNEYSRLVEEKRKIDLMEPLLISKSSSYVDENNSVIKH